MPMTPRTRLGFIIGILVVIMAGFLVYYYKIGLKADEPPTPPKPEYALKLTASYGTTQSVTYDSKNPQPISSFIYVPYNSPVTLTWSTTGFDKKLTTCTPSDNWKEEEKDILGNTSGTRQRPVTENPSIFTISCLQSSPDNKVVWIDARVVAKPSFKTTLTAITSAGTKQVFYDPTDPTLKSSDKITLTTKDDITLSWFIKPEDAPADCKFTGDWTPERDRGSNGSEQHHIDRLHVFDLNCNSEAAISGAVHLTIDVGPATTGAPTPTNLPVE